MTNRIELKSFALGWMLLGDPIAHLLPILVYKVFQILFGILFIIGFIFLYFTEKENNEIHYRRNIFYVLIVFIYTILTLSIVNIYE